MACILTLGLGASVAVSAADSPAAAALRKSVTLDVIAKWCPDVHFHTCEPYFPTSAEELFKGAKVFQVKGDGDETPVGPPPRPIQSCRELGSLKENTWRVQYDLNNPAVLHGNYNPKDRTVTAPMYIYVSVPADASYVDIRYCFLFGFNGAQCMRNLAGPHFNYILGTMAEHFGDWEGFTVRLAPDLNEFVYGLTEAHGNTHRHRRENLDWTGTHPQIRLGLDSHGVYNGHGLNDNDWIELGKAGPCEAIDIVTKEGPVWRPWLQDPAKRPFRICGRAGDGQPSGETWAQFKGRMGVHKVNNPDSVKDVCGGALSSSEYVTAKGEGLLTGVVAFFKSDLTNSMPCSGPGGRGELGPELPALPSLEKQKKFILLSKAGRDLVLSVDRSALDSAHSGRIAAQKTLVLDALKPGDPAQQWYVYEPNPKDKAVCLINVLTGRMAQVEPKNGSRVLLAHRSFVDEYSTWTFGGDRAKGCALRPVWDDGQNLNVSGNGPYKSGSGVCTWGWGGGQANEVWRVLEIGADGRPK
jgi:hypothetical protein